MRIAPAVLVTAMLIAGAAAAQEKPAPPPDYSKAKLTQIFSDVVEAPTPAGHDVQWHPGWVDFKALNMRWRVNFLPFFLPLAGSIRGANAAPIDAFSILNVPYAQTPKTWGSQREIDKELRRIEKMEKERAKVKAETPKSQ